MLLDGCLRILTFLAQAGAPEPVATGVAGPAPGLSWLQWGLMSLYLLACCGLILAVVSTSSKNEGLAGVLGGGGEAQATYRGKKSSEERLSSVSNFLAVGFLILSGLVSYFLGG